MNSRTSGFRLEHSTVTSNQWQPGSTGSNLYLTKFVPNEFFSF